MAEGGNGSCIDGGWDAGENIECTVIVLCDWGFTTLNVSFGLPVHPCVMAVS